MTGSVLKTNGAGTLAVLSALAATGDKALATRTYQPAATGVAGERGKPAGAKTTDRCLTWVRRNRTYIAASTAVG